MINKKKLLVSDVDDNTRIDKWLKRKFSLLTQSYIENKLRRGFIRVNENKIKSNYKVIAGDVISILRYSEEIFKKVKKNKKSISKKLLDNFKNSIIYQSSDFIIINKWSGIFSQAGTNTNISIDDIIKNISNNYSIVHRLDKDTTGLMIIAKNYKSARLFGNLFKNHEIEKKYIAVCQGIPKNLSSIVNLEIEKKKSLVTTVTEYKVIMKLNKTSLILYKPTTGKTHQLRIVSEYLNCPIIGDLKYNKNNNYKQEKLMLNAHYLKFIFKNHKYEFKSKIPNNFIKFIKKNNSSSQIEKKIEDSLKAF